MCQARYDSLMVIHSSLLTLNFLPSPTPLMPHLLFQVGVHVQP
ncbi:hypothetical protein LEMLEM_LOCUS23026, partial [Lemmus lemmus]